MDLSSLRQSVVALSDADDTEATQLLRALRSQHLSSSDERKSIHQSDLTETIDAIIVCMGEHVSSVQVQCHCLAALSNFSFDSDTLRDYIVSNGGMALALQSMRTHADNSEVQADACALLSNMTASNAKDIRKKAGESGAIPLIVSSLNDHRSRSEDVARYASAALSSLAVNDNANCASIGENGGLEAIMDTLGRYSGNEIIVDKTISGLNSTTFTDRENRDRLAKRHGSVGMIVTGMRGHASNERIQKNGLALLRRLVENYTHCADACARCGGIAVIIAAIEGHADNVDIQTHSVALFRRLASTDPRRIEIGLAGGVELVVAAMQRFGSVREVQFQCCAALHNVAIDSDKNGDRVGAAGGIKALLDAIDTFESDEKLVDVACRALYRLSYVGTNKARIRNEDPTNLLYNVAGRYPISCGRTAKGVLKNV